MTTSKERRPEVYNYSEPIQRQRLPYGAVPLDPWRAADPETGKTYALASQERIYEKLADAIREATLGGWFESLEFGQKLQEFLAVSLLDSQTRRIDLNSAAPLEGVVDNDDPKVIRARTGTATPSDLLSLLVDYPGVVSVELAKLSHPLDTMATEEMDGAVNSTLVDFGGELLYEPAVYKEMKRLDPTIPAGIVLRKQALMNLDAPHGVIQIVQRKSFLVRGDAAAKESTGDDYLHRRILNPGRFDELAQKIEAYLPHLQSNPDLEWLQPTATSYYAKYVTSKLIDR